MQNIYAWLHQNRQNEDDNQKTVNQLLAGQYALLCIALYEFNNNQHFNAMLLASLALYVEDIFKKVYTTILEKPEKAQYIQEHPSNFSALKNTFWDTGSKMINAIKKDAEKLYEIIKLRR